MSVPKGGFWTTNRGFEPKAQFRFMVKIDGLKWEDAPGTTGASNQGDRLGNDAQSDTDVAWYAKSVDKPGFELSSYTGDDYFLLGSDSSLTDVNTHKLKVKPISMTLVDPTYPNVTRKLLRWIRRTGYNDDSVKQTLNTIGRTPQESLHKTIGDVRIVQLDNTARSARGAELARLRELGFEPEEDLTLEVWTLHNAYPARIDFGKLDYSSSDLVEIQIDWIYSNFTCQMIRLPDGPSDIEQAFLYFEDYRTSGVDIIKDRKDREEMTCYEIFSTPGANTGWSSNATAEQNNSNFRVWQSIQTGKCYKPLTKQENQDPRPPPAQRDDAIPDDFVLGVGDEGIQTPSDVDDAEGGSDTFTTQLGGSFDAS